MRSIWSLAFAVCLCAADYQAPAGEQAANPRPGAVSVLPGGRMLEPHGRQFATGPAPFGLAVGPNGEQIVAVNGGPDTFSLTVLERDDRGRITGRDLVPSNEDSSAWRSLSSGVAFINDQELLLSEGDSGRVRHVRLRQKEASLEELYELSRGLAQDSYSGDLAYDAARRLAYVADQANSRLVVIDLRQKQPIASIPVGFLPQTVALSPDGRRVYVTNVGMFEYDPIPGASVSLARSTGLAFPAFGFPSPEASGGAARRVSDGEVNVAGLGDPNTPRSHSVSVVGVDNSVKPMLLSNIRTGAPFGRDNHGGSSPSGIVATSERIYVANAHQDSISVIDAHTLEVINEIELRIPGLEDRRGIMPAGMDLHRASGWLLVAEAGINAVAVIDTATERVLGHIPAAWYPATVRVNGDDVYVANVRGHGTGATANRMIAIRERLGRGLDGALTFFPLPAARDLRLLTQRVMELNGFLPREDAEPADYPAEVEHVVLVVKRGRTYDEVLGDVGAVGVHEANGAAMLARYGRFGSARAAGSGFAARFGLRNVNVTPNHHAIALRWSFSDNFYSDASTRLDAHHWLAGVPPNPWTLSSLLAAAGGAKEFRFSESAGRRSFPGQRTAVHPDAIPGQGSLWHHLERHGISFRSYGEGFDLAGAQTGPGMPPSGVRLLTNVPMPDPLYRNSHREYPEANTNIPDQQRMDIFIEDIRKNYLEADETLPRFLYMQLPNDETGMSRPADGYPYAASYVADNDYALGRLIEFLSSTPYWRKMVIFVAEDATSGPDHVNGSRVPLLAIGPWIRQSYVSHRNVSFPGLQKTIYRLLGIPPLNLLDAAATDLSDLFAEEADETPYEVQEIPPELFVPSRARAATQ